MQGFGGSSGGQGRAGQGRGDYRKVGKRSQGHTDRGVEEEKLGAGHRVLSSGIGWGGGGGGGECRMEDHVVQCVSTVVGCGFISMPLCHHFFSLHWACHISYLRGVVSGSPLPASPVLGVGTPAMPELVEVEAARRLCETVVGKSVSRVWIKPDENKVITFPCPQLAGSIPDLQVTRSKMVQ